MSSGYLTTDSHTSNCTKQGKLWELVYNSSGSFLESVPHCLRHKMSVSTLLTLNEWLFGMNLIRIHTHNILFQSMSYSIMIYVLWVFFILLWKRTKKIKLYQYHSTISFASLTWTQVQTIFTGCDPFNQIPTGPTRKSGPPQKVDPFFRNFSGWTKPIHWVLDRNFRKVWLNGSRPLKCLTSPSLSRGAIHSTKIPTGPTGKRGPPQKVDPFFRNFSGWTEPIHWVLDRNFWKFWLNGSHPEWPLSYKTLRWSDQIYYFLCKQKK